MSGLILNGGRTSLFSSNVTDHENGFLHLQSLYHFTPPLELFAWIGGSCAAGAKGLMALCRLGRLLGMRSVTALTAGTSPGRVLINKTTQIVKTTKNASIDWYRRFNITVGFRWHYVSHLVLRDCKK